MIIPRGEKFNEKYNFIEQHGTLKNYSVDISRAAPSFVKESQIVEFFDKYDVTEVSFVTILISMIYKDLKLFGVNGDRLDFVIMTLLSEEMKKLLRYYSLIARQIDTVVLFVLEEDNTCEICSQEEYYVNRELFSKSGEGIILFISQYINMIHRRFLSNNIALQESDNLGGEREIFLLLKKLGLKDRSVTKKGKFWNVSGTRVSNDLDLWEERISEALFKGGTIGYKYYAGKREAIFQEFHFKLEK